LIIRNALIDFWREVHKKAGYQEIKTPQILDKKLWKISVIGRSIEIIFF
jgi:threonyl-tRNA synthetase